MSSTDIPSVIRQVVKSVSPRLLELSHDLHAHPETAWNEHRSARVVSDCLRAVGFEVRGPYLGLATAFAATAGSGPLHLVICAEYDALPGLGHACGHNIISAIAVGAGAALINHVDELGVRLTILGTPAEEGGGGKIELLDRGAFTDVQAAVMIHPGPLDVARAEPYAVSHSHVRFDGKSAHAAAYPECGVNAADAFTLSQVAIGLLRQQLPGTVRVHGLVTRGGEAPNAIAARTEGRWYVRASTLAELADIEPRITRCFEAGAHATGSTLTITAESAPYAEFRNDDLLLSAYVEHAEEVGRRFHGGGEARMNRASTDMGNVSQLIPAIHPYIGIDSLPAVNHQPEFAAATIAPAADRAIVDGATALALTLHSAATRPHLRTHLLQTDALAEPSDNSAAPPAAASPHWKRRTTVDQ